MRSKCQPPERTHALSRTRHWSMEASMTSCSMLLQTLSRHCPQFVNISNLCLVDALLHCSPDFAERRTCTQETFRCMHAFGRRPFWTHAVNLSVWTHEQADNFPGRHVLKLNVIAPYWVYWLSCKVVQLCIQVSQGSAATDLRWGGHYNITFFSSRSQNTTVKELLQEAQLSQRGRAMPRVVE